MEKGLSFDFHEYDGIKIQHLYIHQYNIVQHRFEVYPFFLFKFKHFYSCRKRIIISIFLLHIVPQSFFCVYFFMYYFLCNIVKKWDPFHWVMANISLPFADILLFCCPLNRQHLFIYFWPKKYTKLQLYFVLWTKLFTSKWKQKIQITEWFDCYGFPIG